MHVPVLTGEVLHTLSPSRSGIYVDGTVGDGGHASAILESSGPDGFLLGIDLDPFALERAEARLGPYRGRYHLQQGNFADLPSLIGDRGPVDGILLDLGVSTPQLEDPSRGFSFAREGPLDMRMDPGGPMTAATLVNEWPEADLFRLLKDFGEERYARRIARRICRSRGENPLKSTVELADIITGAVPRRSRIHPATRAFQAFRIAVNREMENLSGALAALSAVLKPGGRAVVISFHSLEDRQVKRSFREGARQGIFEILTPRPLTASPEERAAHPKSRSAKLRAVRKTME
ncbi:MAG: 16S rRNA (cytosine(1402)-N(4))-methyltransferase RsmH [Planctomycetota bacterium]|jgi:16S rRNA (cytosine1402-N4)-methyltransferase